MTTATATGRTRTWRIWFVLTVPVVAWMAHLVSLSALTNLACDHDSIEWVLHAITGALALVCLAALWISYRLVQEGTDDEESGTEAGRTNFLGLLGLVIGGANLALILLEGSYVLFIRSCA